MLPTTTDFLSLPFFLWAVIAFYGGVAFHELGHALAGSLAGRRIAACGLGRRPPFLYVRIRGICFFVGVPLSPGLTIAVSDQIGTRARGMSILLLGGPLANVAVAAGSLG